MPIFGRRRPALAASGNPLRVTGDANRMGGSLTAAAYRVHRRDVDAIRRLAQPWQARAFSYYDLLGEIKYAAQFYARMLAPLELFAGEKDPETGEVKRSEDPVAIAALERIQDPGLGGRQGLQGQYGRLMFITGEAYLFQSRDPDTELEQWEMLSTDELRIMDGTYYRYKAPSLNAEEYHEPKDEDWTPVDNEAIAYRFWKRHPRFSMLADSTMQGVLDDCEELLLLTQAVRARARSRLAGSGILAVADEFSLPPLSDEGDEDGDVDPFLRDLTEAMTTPIVDEGAASAVVPLVIRAPADVIEKGIKHIQIIDPTQVYPETGLRYELIKRIAIGLDMPPEILLGLADSNHWTSWQIDEQTWKGHGQPIAEQLCADLTASYYRPTLRASEEHAEDWQRFVVAYDATAIINHPDRSKDAKDLYAGRAIGKAALREAAGFDEDDAPDKTELAEMVGIATRDSSLAWYGVPAPRGGALEPAAGEVVSAKAGGTGEAGTPEEGTGAGAEETPPAPHDDDPGSVIGAALRNGNGNGDGHHQAMAARILGAADLALLRAREAAGNRLRSLAKRDAELRVLLEGVRSGQVAATLGRERVRSLKQSEADLVAGARELIADALRVWGIDDASLATLLTENIERHAARTLYDLHPSALPASFSEYVTGILVGAT